MIICDICKENPPIELSDIETILAKSFGYKESDVICKNCIDELKKKYKIESNAKETIFTADIKSIIKNAANSESYNTSAIYQYLTKQKSTIHDKHGLTINSKLAASILFKLDIKPSHIDKNNDGQAYAWTYSHETIKNTKDWQIFTLKECAITIDKYKKAIADAQRDLEYDSNLIATILR